MVQNSAARLITGTKRYNNIPCARLPPPCVALPLNIFFGFNDPACILQATEICGWSPAGHSQVTVSDKGDCLLQVETSHENPLELFAL